MSNPSPTLTFRVKLELNIAETLGPKTNEASTHMLHPSMHQDSPDLGRLEKAVFKHKRSTWLNSLLSGGGNRQLAHGDEFVEHGSKAIYIRNLYVSGEWNNHNPQGGDLLELV